MKAVQKILGRSEVSDKKLHRTNSESAASDKDKKRRSPKSESRKHGESSSSSTPKSERRRSGEKKEKRRSSDQSHMSPLIHGIDDNEDGIVVMASLDISQLSLEAQAKASSPTQQPVLSRSAKSLAPSSSSPVKSPSGERRSESKPKSFDKHRESSRSSTSGAAEESPRSKDRSERSERSEKKKERSERSERHKSKTEQFEAGTTNALLEETLKMSPRNTKKSTPVFKTPFEYGLPTSPKEEEVQQKKPPPLSATRGPSVRDMASNWQRPVLNVSTNSAVSVSPADGLSPAASSFESRLAEQEERRKKLDEIQAARDKLDDSDNEEREMEERKLQAVIAEVTAKEKMLAKHGSRRTSLEDSEPVIHPSLSLLCFPALIFSTPSYHLSLSSVSSMQPGITDVPYEPW
jgi:hypothetical protein